MSMNIEKKKKASLARKTSSLPTKNLVFGVLHVGGKRNQLLMERASEDGLYFNIQNIKTVEDQVFKGFLYRNRLVDIECKRRTRYREIRSTLSDEMMSLTQQYNEATEVYHELRKKLCEVPKSQRDDHPLVLEVRRAREKVKGIYKDLKTETTAVEKEYFQEASTFYKAKLQELNYDNYGPASKKKVEIRAAVLEDMRELFHSAWVENFELEEEARAEVKKARAESGCFSGVYQAVDAAAKRSFQDSPFNPRKAPFQHRGKVGLQILKTKTKGLALDCTWEQALSCQDSRIKVRLYPDCPVRWMTRFRKKVAQQLREQGLSKKAAEEEARFHYTAAVASIKIAGREDSKEAVYVEVPFLLHRPIDKKAVLKWVYLDVSRLGQMPTYQLRFTVESETFNMNRTALKGTLAVNLGWRVLSDGSIKVATTWDGLKSSEIILPAEMRESFEVSKKLLGYKDDHFNDAKKALKSWMKENKTKPSLVKQLKEKYVTLNTVSNWRSTKHMAKTTFAFRGAYLKGVDIEGLWQEWKRDRLSVRPKKMSVEQWRRKGVARNDKDLFASYLELSKWFQARGHTSPHVQMALYLEWWRRKDSHLDTYARTLQEKIRLRKQAIYRTFARVSANTYLDVIVEDWDKSVTAKKPKPEDDTRTQQDEASNKIRQFCGVSVLTSALENAFDSEHYHKGNTKGTRVHLGCGGPPPKDSKTLVEVSCPKCSRRYNQDVNTARHLWSQVEPEDGVRVA